MWTQAGYAPASHDENFEERGPFFMKDVRSTVMQLSGRWGNTCYNMLCLAVEAAKGLPREEFQMKRVWSAVREATGKSPETILPRPDPRGDGHLGAWEPGDAHGDFCPDADESADSQGACVYAGGICEAVAGLPVLLGAALRGSTGCLCVWTASRLP